MGKRGPAPMPTELKVLHGETRPQRLNPDRPRPGTVEERDGKTVSVHALPLMPPDMDARAEEVWRRQIESMGATGILTPVDGDALRAYCEAVSRYEYAARLLASSGPLVKGARSGDLVKNPLHQVVRDNAVLLRLFARELGFVPAGREGIRPGGPSDRLDDFDIWLEAPG